MAQVARIARRLNAGDFRPPIGTWSARGFPPRRAFLPLRCRPTVGEAEACRSSARPDTLITLKDIYSPLRGIFATHASQAKSPVFKPFFSRY